MKKRKVICLLIPITGMILASVYGVYINDIPVSIPRYSLLLAGSGICVCIAVYLIESFMSPYRLSVRNCLEAVFLLAWIYIYKKYVYNRKREFRR